MMVGIDKTFNIEAPRKFLPKQLEVLDACKIYKGILYSGAFRAGKTLVLAHVGIGTSLENPGTEGLIGSQTHTTLKSVVLDTFQKELQLYQEKINDAGIKLQLDKYINRSEGKMEIMFYNGSRIRFRACDEERKLAGYTLDWFGIDEPIDVDENIFNQLMGRISGTGNLKNKFGLLTTNPGSELHWIYENFYWDDSPDNYIHIDTTTYDNRLLPDYNNYIETIERQWDKDWILRYLDGQWGMFSGQIYKDFNPAKMRGDFTDIPIDYHIAGVDWGLSSPHSLLDVGVTEDKRLIVLREHYGSKMTTAELSKLIQQWHKDVNFRKVYCDSSANDLIQQTYEKGVPIAYSSRDTLHSYAESGAGSVDNGIARVKSLLRKKIILYDQSCIHFEQEMQAYRYKEGTEKPIKENDHSCDALRYLTTDFSPDSETLGFRGTMSKLFKRKFQ